MCYGRFADVIAIFKRNKATGSVQPPPSLSLKAHCISAYALDEQNCKLYDL